jgi:hypothetical protein
LDYSKFTSIVNSFNAANLRDGFDLLADDASLDLLQIDLDFLADQPIRVVEGRAADSAIFRRAEASSAAECAIHDRFDRRNYAHVQARLDAGQDNAG